jgi:hypothetical protein
MRFDANGRRAIALVSLLVAAGCDPGDEGLELQPPSADLTGSWVVSETLYGNCAGVTYPEVKTYTATVTQAGNDLTIVNEASGAALTGYISGSTVNLNLSFTDGAGTTTGNFPGTVSSDGDAFGGLGTFSWTNTARTSACSGTSRLAASRGGIPLPAPAGLAATAGYSQVTLSWTSSIGATKYYIRRSTVAGGAATGSVVMITPEPLTRTFMKWLANGTPYYFAITALNAAGAESPASPEVSATPLDTFTRPATPTNVVATPGAGKVTLSCDAVPAATRYFVYLSTTPGQLATYAALQGHGSWTGTNPAGIQVLGLTPGTPYYFAVTAWNEDGESTPATEVAATPL